MDFHFIQLLAPYFRPHAYLDPGSGSFIIQLLIGVLAGLGILLKVYWKKVTGFFSRTKAKDADTSPIDADRKEDSDAQQ
jgi:hypothetical protein